MRRVMFALLLALIVVVVFGASIGAVYVYVLPKFFPGPGWGAYWPLFLGIIIATLIGGYIGYRVPATDKLSIQVWSGLCYAVVVGCLVSYASMVIILSTRGS